MNNENKESVSVIPAGYLVYPPPRPYGYGGYGPSMRNTQRQEHTQTYVDPTNKNITHTTHQSTQNTIGNTVDGYWNTGGDGCFLWLFLGLACTVLFFYIFAIILAPGGRLHCGPGGCNSLCNAVEECSVIEGLMERIIALETAGP